MRLEGHYIDGEWREPEGATFEVINPYDGAILALCASGGAVRLGEQLEAGLDELAGKHRLVGEHRGLGAMRAIELVTDRDAKTPAAAQTAMVSKEAAQRGLLTLGAGTYGNVVRILAPLTTPPDQVDEGLAILGQCLALVAES